MASKKPLKIVGIVLGVFVLLIVAAIIILSIMFPAEKIKAMVLPQIEKAVGRSVDIEGAGLSFFPVFGAKVKGLKIANTERKGFSSEPFVTLEEFLVGVKVLPLLQKKLAIKAIVFRKPVILIEVNRMGAYNYDDLAFMAPKESDEKEKPEEKPEEKKPGGPPALPIPMTLEKFAIQNGKVIYHDYKAGRFITIGEINHRIDFSIDKALKDVKTTGELILTGISVRTGEIPKPLTGVSFTFSHDLGVNVVDGEAVINSMRVSLQKIYIACTGTVKNFNAEPAIDLKIKTEKISIADLLAEIPVEMFPDVGKLKARGFMQLAMILKGTIDEKGVPHLKGKFTLGDGHIQYADLPEPISDIRADISFTKNSLIISDFGFNLGKNPVLLKASIKNFAMPEVDAVLKATVNLDDLKNIVTLPEGVTLSGTIKSDITANGIVDPADPMKVRVDGNIVITNLRAKTPDLPKPVVVNGTMNFSPKQVANNMRIGIGSSDVAIKAKISDYLALVVKDSTKRSPRPKLNFNVASSMLNTDDLLTEKEKKAAPQAQESRASAEPAPVSSGPAPILAAPLPGVDMKGSITCKRILYQGVKMSNFNTQVSSVNDVMKVNTRANMFSGTLSNNVNMDARNLNNVKIANTFNISKIQVNDFITNLNIWMGEDQPLLKDLDKNLFGTLTLHTNFKTNGATTEDASRNLDGTVNAKVADGKIKSNAFTNGINNKVAGFAKKVRLPIDKLINFGDITFSSLKFLARIKEERVFFDDFSLNSRTTGDWDVGGNVGFDGGLDVVLTDRLPKNVSKRVLAVQDKVKGGASKLIKQGESALGKKLGSGVSQALGKAAAKKLDENFITPDKEGRVSMFINYGGNAAAPKPTKFGFKRYEGTGTEEKTTAKQDLKKELKKKVDTIKKEAVKQVKKQAEKVTQEVKKEAVKAVEKQVPKEVKEETKKATKDVKKKAKKKLKKLFK